MIPTSTVRIVIAGGNYSGLNALHHLYASLLTNKEHPNIQITLVDRRSGFLHYIGMTRGLTEPQFGSDIWVPYSSIPWLNDHPQITFKQATVHKITSNQVLLTNGESLEFDYLVIALGLSRFAPIGTGALNKPEYLKSLQTNYQQIVDANSIAVIGGGAVGCEMAADLKCDFPQKHITLVHSRNLPIAGPFKDEFRQQTVDTLKDIGVNMVMGERVLDQQPPSQDIYFVGNDTVEANSSTSSKVELTLSSGKKIQADWAIRCLGTRDKRALVNLYKSDGTNVFDSNGIDVLDTMQVIDNPQIFAVGDICSRDQIKLAGVAMYGGYIAGRNISRLIIDNSSELELASKYPPKLLLLLGKNHYTMQYDQEIWERDQIKPHVHDDMGLKVCVESLSLHKEPSSSNPFLN